MIPGTVHRSPGIYLPAEENPRKLHLGTVHEGCTTSHHLKWGSLPPNEVGRITRYVRKGEGRKGGKDVVGNSVTGGSDFFFTKGAANAEDFLRKF